MLVDTVNPMKEKGGTKAEVEMIKEREWWQKEDGDNFVARESVDEEQLRRGLEYRIEDGVMDELPLNYRMWEMFLYGSGFRGWLVFAFWFSFQVIFCILVIVVLVTSTQTKTHNISNTPLFVYYIIVSLITGILYVSGRVIVTKKDVYALLESIRNEVGEETKNEAYAALRHFTWLGFSVLIFQYSFFIYSWVIAPKVPAAYIVLYFLWSVPCYQPTVLFTILWLWILYAVQLSNISKIKKMITLDKIYNGSANKEVVLGMMSMQVLCNRWTQIHIVQLLCALTSLFISIWVMYEVMVTEGIRESFKFTVISSCIMQVFIYYGFVWVSCVATGYVNDKYFRDINIRILELLVGVKNAKYETAIEKVSRRNRYVEGRKAGDTNTNTNTKEIVDSVEEEELTLDCESRLMNLRQTLQFSGNLGLNYGGVVLTLKSGLSIGAFIGTVVYTLALSAFQATLSKGN